MNRGCISGFLCVLTVSLLIALGTSPLMAQTTLGDISGSVTVSGNGVPGVTVTATSPKLQGQRVTYTGDNGVYFLHGLPPGPYAIKFELSGMTGVDKRVTVDLGQTARLDADMTPAATKETITVVATSPTALTTTQLGSNYKYETITQLPIARTLSSIAALTPGVDTATFNAGQLRIGGAFGYDNVFLVDGTDVNDNLFGTANGLYIEDAIAETQVMTGGISAEYGRFTGGVVNAITKSGGNDFAGTLRDDLSRPNWTSLTPFEETRSTPQRPTRTLGKVYQGTLGGPILKDRLWFFGAGRDVKTTGTTILTETGIPLAQSTSNPRYEGKLTATIAAKHTIQGSYITNNTTQGGNLGLGGTIDLRSAVTRQLPNSGESLFYNGIFTQSLFGELKFSRKLFGFRGAGGTLTDIHESPFLNATGAQRVYNAPYFDANDPENRNNKDISATMSYFLSTKSMGSHDVKGGLEDYISTRTGGNSQTATGYVYFADPKRVNGVAITDANGRYIPTFIPCVSNGGVLQSCAANALFVNNWLATRGAKVDLTTKAGFINDTWNLNKNWSFILGGRFEKVTGSATGGITTVDSSRFTPRLGSSWDVFGSGRTKVDLTAGQYSGRYLDNQFSKNTPVGNPSRVTYAYIGPAGEGLGFAPAFDIKNFVVTSGSFPLQNVFVNKGIKSPVVTEYTVGLGQAVSTNGFFKVVYTNRKWKDFVEDFVGGGAGFTHVIISPTVSANLDNTTVGNSSIPQKAYSSVQLLSQYRPLRHWNSQLAYTRELNNNGNFVGEAGNQPGNSSLIGNYPEIYEPNVHIPTGRLPGYEKDRVRWLNTYDLSLSRFGALNIGLIGNYDSPLTFSYATAVPTTAIQKAAILAAGDKSAPTSTTVFFGRRGAGQFASQKSLDAALTYSLPIFSSRVAPWIKAEMTNVTNAHKLISWTTTIIQDPTSPRDPLGLPTGFLRCGLTQKDSSGATVTATAGCGGVIFGNPTSAASYQAARAYDFAVGLRF